MIFDMDKQITLFFFSVINGMAIGVLYDFYRVIRGFEEPGKIITALQDILFWILTGIIIFILMLYTNYAYMSFNVFLYNGLGLVLYFKILSKHTITIVDKLIDLIVTVIRITFNWLFYPLRIIFHKLRKKA